MREVDEFAALEDQLGPALDQLDRSELMRLSYAAFRGQDFPMQLVRPGKPQRPMQSMHTRREVSAAHAGGD